MYSLENMCELASAMMEGHNLLHVLSEQALFHKDGANLHDLLFQAADAIEGYGALCHDMKGAAHELFKAVNGVVDDMLKRPEVKNTIKILERYRPQVYAAGLMADKIYGAAPELKPEPTKE